MGVKTGRSKKAAARRRIRTFPVGIKIYPEPSKEGEKKWGSMMALAGVFLFALVAFLSGIWMGKTVNELQYTGETFLQTQKEKTREGKRKPAAPDGLWKEGDRSRVEGKRSLSESSHKRQEKNRMALPTKPSDGEEKRFKPAEKSPSPSSPETESPAAKSRFTLQLGAFSSSEEAKKLVSQLQSKGYAAYEITVKGAAKYRVRVGHFPSLQEARQFALMFEKKEKMKPLITPEPPP